jgi:hypothetical protein
LQTSTFNAFHARAAFTITKDLEADDFCDPDDKYIVNVQCAVTVEDPAKPNEKIEIGSMSFGIVQVGRAIKNRERLYDVFDAESGDYEYVYETLVDIDKRGEFKKDIQKRFGIKSGNVFILNNSRAASTSRSRASRHFFLPGHIQQRIGPDDSDGKENQRKVPPQIAK